MKPSYLQYRLYKLAYTYATIICLPGLALYKSMEIFFILINRRDKAINYALSVYCGRQKARLSWCRSVQMAMLICNIESQYQRDGINASMEKMYDTYEQFQRYEQAYMHRDPKVFLDFLHTELAYDVKKYYDPDWSGYVKVNNGLAQINESPLDMRGLYNHDDMMIKTKTNQRSSL